MSLFWVCLGVFALALGREICKYRMKTLGDEQVSRFVADNHVYADQQLTVSDWKSYHCMIVDCERERLCLGYVDYRSARFDTYKLGELGGVFVRSDVENTDYGDATENILRGAAIGGESGAFMAAMGPSGTRSRVAKLALVVHRRQPYKINFSRIPVEPLNADVAAVYPLPLNAQARKFADDCHVVANEAIYQWNERHPPTEEQKRSAQEYLQKILEKQEAQIRGEACRRQGAAAP